jgi:hypothetical protein
MNIGWPPLPDDNAKSILPEGIFIRGGHDRTCADRGRFPRYPPCLNIASISASNALPRVWLMRRSQSSID